MRLDQLRRMAVFVRVVEAGSFAQAARELGLAPSVVTHAVQALEAELGVKLLARTTRERSLTAAGRPFYESCARMVESAREALAIAEAETGAVAGRLTVSCSIAVAAIVADAVARLVEAHPRLLPELRVDEHVVDLVRDPVDIAVRSGWIRDGQLVARKLCDFPERLVAAPDYLARRGEPRRVEDLAAHAMVHLSAFEQPGGLDMLLLSGTTTRIQVAAAARTNNAEAARLLVLRGVGLGRLPLAAVRDDLAAGRLRVLFAGQWLSDAAIYAVTLQRSPLPKKVVLALAALKAAFAAHSRSWRD
jgi:DNA-binding transcriptional LysR family regulator